MRHKINVLLGFLVFFLASCSVSRFIPEGEYMLDKVSIVSDSTQLSTADLAGYIRQHPNSKWFNLVKAPMLPYLMSSTDTSKAINRFLQRIGEAPVIEDSILTARCRADIEAAVRNLGYLDAEVKVERKIHKNRVSVKYLVQPHQRYTVGLLERDIQDDAIAALLQSSQSESLLSEGMPFDMNVFSAERNRIVNIIQNNGYYRFNQEFLRYEADSTEVPLQVWVKEILEPYRSFGGPTMPHQLYRFGDVTFHYTNDNTHFRNSMLTRINYINEGDLYNEQKVQDTYAALGGLDAVLGSSIRFTANPNDSLCLDANIEITPSKLHSLRLGLEGTNSAGDLGAAASLAYQNRNLFHGSELLAVKFRHAFEAIKGLDGYDDQNYLEFSAEATLKFPDFIFPFLSRGFRRQAKASSEVSVMWESQNRPEFHRRVLTGAWRYRWTSHNRQMHHRVDLIDLNYVYMPWISDTFKRDYLDDPTSRNAILRYNYENLFIMKWGYTLSFSNMAPGQVSNYGTNAYSIRLNAETAGNLLQGIAELTHASNNAEGYHNIFGIAFAQYAKVDFDFAKSFRINPRNSVALHFGLGVALPYGNSTILPYEKRYFSGGANSVRGWSVRGLGPGRFKGSDGRIDFINQTGDIKLDMNFEYRTHLFWKVDGAVFLDAGNIWTLREYDEQPGGQFAFDTFWREIAVAYGIGLRLNFNYFVLRFDGGMKAINPAYDNAKQHFSIIHPSFKRDFTFHFAVGLPF